MIKILRLYPSVKVTGQSFKKVVRRVMPNQSMSLREIVARFTKRESLPLSHEGFYEERFGDLEKHLHEDITEKVDRVNELKSTVSKGRKAEKERQEADAKTKRDAEVKAEVDKAVAEAIKPKGPAHSPPV